MAAVWGPSYHTLIVPYQQKQFLFLLSKTHRAKGINFYFCFPHTYIEGAGEGEANLHKVSHAGTHRQTHRRRDRQADRH